MKPTIIEQLDKSRYRLVKWMTIGWALWFGFYIIKDHINSKIVFGLLLLLGLLGGLLSTVNVFRYIKLGKIVNSDIKLKDALNNELIRLNAYKSFFIGFWIVISIISIFFIIAIFYTISALIVCEITLYFGILSSLIASLIYNRD
jgi:type IV secretory pathway VirB6-like protein